MEAFKPLTIHVITLSDRAFRGEYSDESGPMISNLIYQFFADKNWEIGIQNTIIPDEADELEALLKADIAHKTDVVITTGGTGVGKRDITPEVAKKLIAKEVPGIMEHIRLKYGSEKPNALLSRGVAGVTDDTQIYTLPGSLKAVKEYMGEILKTLEHLVYMIHGIDTHGKSK
ncbi:MAG TPA: molybdenum cofactor biosynthesis protein [Bacteroidales bacterium]|nr:molybdenum cofactor biosynthesis protein [Bacteroidales bacterium]